jgi:hypothetical protein
MADLCMTVTAHNHVAFGKKGVSRGGTTGSVLEQQGNDAGADADQVTLENHRKAKATHSSYKDCHSSVSLTGTGLPCSLTHASA